MNVPSHQTAQRPTPTTGESDAGIHKAAMLVSCLDRAAADAMLDSLQPRQQQRIRQAMVELGEIDQKQQRRVIDEFFRARPAAPVKHSPGIELDDPLARKLAGSQEDLAGDKGNPERQPGGGRPFCFLNDAEDEKLARILAGERPQTIALVLSHLPPKRAGGLLARFPAALQADVVRRLVHLEETDPEILREVETALESRLWQQVRMQRRRVAGLPAVMGILQASDGRVGMQILDNLAACDPSLADRLAPPRLDFRDLARLDEQAFQAVFAAADPKLASVALIGAPPELIDRVARRITPAEAETLQHKLEHPGPIRLSDVEEARRQMADLARRLAAAGQIKLPHRSSSLIA